MKSQAAILVFLILAAAGHSVHVFAQAPPPPKPVPSANSEEFLGSLAGQTYTNKFFGFSIRVPDGYTVLNRAEVDVYTKAGADLLKGDTESSSRAMDAALQQTVHLLIISKLPPGNLGNAAFELSVAKQPPGVTESMVLAETVKIMTMGGKARLINTATNRTIGNRKFYAAEFQTTVAEQVLTQNILFTIVRGYAISIGLTFTTPESMSAFDEMLATVHFSSK